MAKIKYICKNCNWETSIREEWKDLKPRRCMNRKCNTSFIRKPQDLIIQVPETSKPVVHHKKVNKQEPSIVE